jgi:hypothetical protein
VHLSCIGEASLLFQYSTNFTAIRPIIMDEPTSTEIEMNIFYIPVKPYSSSSLPVHYGPFGPESNSKKKFRPV